MKRYLIYDEIAPLTPIPDNIQNEIYRVFGCPKFVTLHFNKDFWSNYVETKLKTK